MGEVYGASGAEWSVYKWYTEQDKKKNQDGQLRKLPG